MSEQNHNARFNAILAEMRGLRDADRIVVFGSIARGSINPNDIDVYVESELQPRHDLLALARRHYGYVDVFTRIKGEGYQSRLLVRNDEATDWMPAKNSRSITSSIKLAGRPLHDIPDLPV